MPVRTDFLREELGEQAEVREVPLPFGEWTAEQLETYWQEIEPADALFVRTGIIPAQLISRCPRLKIITLHGAGVDQVDLSAAQAAGIWVTNLPGVNANAVAELTVGLMLALLRKVALADRLLRHGDWEAARQIGRELRGKTVGLVGFGNIGRRVAAMLKAFSVNLLYYDAVGPRGGAEERAQFRSLDQLLAVSDIVSLHVPSSPETHHLLDERRLGLLQPHALLINTARGPIVDQFALYTALQEGRLAGAALDVFDPEPLRAGHPLTQLDNVIITPHIAGSTDECLEDLARKGAAELLRVLRGELPQHAV
jgi:phosphoglycerate dehydrogenase-like enzyme